MDLDYYEQFSRRKTSFEDCSFTDTISWKQLIGNCWFQVLKQWITLWQQWIVEDMLVELLEIVSVIFFPQLQSFLYYINNQKQSWKNCNKDNAKFGKNFQVIKRLTVCDQAWPDSISGWSHLHSRQRQSSSKHSRPFPYFWSK